MAAKSAKPIRRSLLRRAAVFVAKWTFTAAIWGVVAALLLGGWYASDLPDVDSALKATRKPTVTLLADDGTPIARRGDLYGLPVQLADLPQDLPNAVIATEDRRFYNHFGLDIIGLARAVVANIKARRIVQGGSTITQQAAKNLFLTPERSLRRKIQELMLALWLEHKFSKQQILTIYLNRVYLGAGTYGVDAAARKYFGKPATRVSTYEAAMLAGLLKAPSRYNPRSSRKRAHGRTVQVLANMVAAGYLSPNQAKAAKAVRSTSTAVATGSRQARHFVDWVLNQVPSYVAPGDRDLIVVTTLRTKTQRAAEAAILGAVDKADAARATQAALVALAPDGAVRAMVGGRNYGTSQFNRATQARRQPGSAFKPIVYLAGLEAGLKPETMIEDAPLSIGEWRPRNFDGKYRGKVSVSDALVQSLNTAAVRVAERAGLDRIVETARRLGITTALKPAPSLALGAGEVSLLELTSAYGPFANGGNGVWAYGVTEIRDTAGQVIYRRQGSGPGRVVRPGRVTAMNRMLSRVITEGTGRKARFDRPIAGKTGTSQNFRDAWFIGYSAELIAGVWMGNDDGRSMKGVTGGGLPAITWRNFMIAAHKGRSDQPLPTPPPGGPEPEEPGFWDKLYVRITGDGPSGDRK